MNGENEIFLNWIATLDKNIITYVRSRTADNWLQTIHFDAFIFIAIIFF